MFNIRSIIVNFVIRNCVTSRNIIENQCVAFNMASAILRARFMSNSASIISYTTIFHNGF